MGAYGAKIVIDMTINDEYHWLEEDRSKVREVEDSADWVREGLAEEIRALISRYDNQHPGVFRGTPEVS